MLDPAIAEIAATRHAAPTRPGFMAFYHGDYAADHRHPANRALHMAGTIAGLAVIGAGLTIIPLGWALSFPIVHAVPGLIGHRLFDRNAALGDVRFLRGKYPAHWFIIANHLMTAQVMARALGMRGAKY